MGFINETFLIKSLKSHKSTIRVQVLEDGKKVNVSNGYYLVHLSDSYHKTIAFLQQEGFLDSKLNVLKGEANLQSISDSLKDDYKAKITRFTMEDDHDKPKNRRMVCRMVKANGKLRAYNEEYIQVFASPLANEYQLTFKSEENGYTLGVYYGDFKVGITLGVRYNDLEEKVKEVAV